MPRPPVNPIAVWIGILVLYVVWGSTYLGMKVAMDTLPVFVMGVFRFVPAGIILTLAVIAWNRGRIARPTVAQARDASIVGIMLLLGGTGLVAWGEQTIPTGIAALLIALVPMWLAIFGFALFRESVPPLVAAGIVVGLVGVAILAWPAGDVGSLDPAGLLALMVSPIFWTLGTLYATKRAVQPAPALLASGIHMLAAGLAFVVVAAVTGEWAAFDIAAVSPTSWASIAYLIVAGSLIGYTTYAWLIGVAPIQRVATYAYVNPVVAVILGWLVLSEPLTPRTILAGVVIVAAVALIVTGRGRVRTPAAAEPAVSP
ncbi:MAG TPA: EamA family transporter, partial [Candidatus Limnocylindrales bacterium]|nr:EamA family transporter [Candidatus Limnocylindrales bacterium]